MPAGALGAAEILRTWERGAALHAIDRALLLCALAAPELERASLAALSLGERDGLLLRLHERTFGERVQAVVACPACRAPLEVAVTVAGLRVTAPGDAAPTVALADRQLRLRKLDSRDLAAIATVADAAAARRQLIARGIVGEPGTLSESDEALVAQRLGELDPQADLVFDLSCGECQERFTTQLDLGEYVWSELSLEARRLMSEVVTLARAFKWSEADILAMSPRRRQLYLELADA
jgi:hypothetical protein